MQHSRTKVMSWLTFLASDSQLKSIENPHIKKYSVNEALEKGIDVPQIVLDSVDIDQNDPNVILWVESEELLGDITIQACQKTTIFDNLTSLIYCSSLEWSYSESRAQQLIQYIYDHLETSDKIEVWSLWDGYIEGEPKQKVDKVELKTLRPTHFKKRTEWDYQCIVVYRNEE